MVRISASNRGFSAAEATIILSAMSILAATTMPALVGYITDARQARAREEVRIVASALSRLDDDLLSRADVPGGLATLEVAVSDGDVAKVSADADQAFAKTGTGVGSLNDQLVSNAVGYATAGSKLPQGIRGWSGPYLDRPLGADPWGHRYVVRFGHGARPSLVVSAGPDGEITTVDSRAGIVVGADDIVSVVAVR